jgi:hypothetical protein
MRKTAHAPQPLTVVVVEYCDDGRGVEQERVTLQPHDADRRHDLSAWESARQGRRRA